MKLLNILSLAACVFGTLVAASPVAAPAASELVTRNDKAGQPIVDCLIKLEVEIDKCTKKWEGICSSRKCGEVDIVSFQAEIAAIITLAAKDIKGKIPAGFVFIDASVCIKILVSILVKINACLHILLKACGFLAVLFITIVLRLCLDLSVAIKLLISVLAVCIDGLLIKLTAALTVALGGVLCLVCSLLSIIL